MLLQDKYNISDRIFLLIIAICGLPFVLHLFGINFGFVNGQLSLDMISRLIDFEKGDLQEVLRGRYVHTIFVSFSIAISFLTIILAFIDFRIKGELSTPIVGVALFCSGIFYTFHVLVATNVVHAPSQQFYLTSFTWLFCRAFHASILIFGVSIFLIRSKKLEDSIIRNSRKVVLYITIIFVLITCVTIILLFLDTNIPRMAFPYRNISRPYDLIPLGLYLISAFYILPKFYIKYPSIFSQTLLLSMIPAIATQLYMAFGCDELFDNNFNISHFMAAFTYFIPFIGLSLNYLQTHKNERRVILQLNHEAHERRAVEETLSGVLNSSPSSIMSFRTVRDREGNIIDFEWTLVNPATEILFGYNYRALFGKRLLETLPFVRVENWPDMFSRVVENNEPMNYEYFSEHFHKWFLMIGVKLDDGLAVTISDISKRKNALQELMNAERLAVTGRIARTIAHEVRNPLTNINLSIEHMQGSSAEDHEMYVDIIRRNSERINLLITELLNSSKSGNLKLERQSINKILDETLEFAADRMRLKSIRLEKNYHAGAFEINADADNLRTALLNLVINAVEAMEEGKGILKVTSSCNEQNCFVEIEDNGSGMDEESRQKLFEPFFSKKSKGMGLGLTATQNIIIAHKGTIDVESKPGKGTKFRIGFPV